MTPPAQHQLDHESELRPAVRRSKSSRRRDPPAEKHTDYGDIMRDTIIGFADGLTVPFALTASLSSLGSSKLVITGGLAELFSGAISMGLGAYLASVTERDHYLSEENRERDEIINQRSEEREECFDILDAYGISEEASGLVIRDLQRNPDNWVKFMMDFELKLEKPNVSRAWISAATMGMAYFVGGLIPMIPYFVMVNVTHALFVSIGITFVILVVFGYVKNYVTIRTKKAGFYGALQTLVIGALAAGAAYGIVRAVNATNSSEASFITSIWPVSALEASRSYGLVNMAQEI